MNPLLIIALSLCAVLVFLCGVMITNRNQIKRFSEPDDTDMIYWMDSDLIIKKKGK